MSFFPLPEFAQLTILPKKLMKQIVITLLAICFSATIHAQFLYKLKRPPNSSVTALAPISITGTVTIDNISPTLIAAAGTITTVTFVFNTQENLTSNQFDENLSIVSGPTFLLGTGNNESIFSVEFLSGHFFKHKRDKLSIGGTFASSDSKETNDLKTLLQGGGNMFISYTYPIISRQYKNDNNFWAFLFRTKLGGLVPKANTITNVIQASFDPGVEFYFSLATLNDDIGITASIRGSVLWATKDFSDAIGFKENIVPYGFITGGIKLKSLGSSIVYSQSFLAKNLAGLPQPKGSLGLSIALGN